MRNTNHRHRAAAAGLWAAAVLMPICALGADGGVSGGLTLLEAAGARAAALGEAFSAVGDDVSAAAYNPASVATLLSPEASVSYHRGLTDDAFGRVQVGGRGFAVGVGYYNAGKVDLFENGATRSVNAQTDLAASVTAAREFHGASWGASLKYLTSQLAESDRASAYAVDLGVQVRATRRIRVGSALQNFGTKLTYVSDGDPLPRIARIGTEIRLAEGRVPVLLLLDAPYFLNEKELRGAAGLEVGVGPLHLRGGYRTGSEIEGLSVGTGISVGNLNVDYAFGFSSRLDSSQRISIGFRFGEKAAAADLSRARPEKAETAAILSPAAQFPEVRD